VTHKVKDPSRKVEPLILRVSAGEWLQVTLFNDFPAPPYSPTSPFNARVAASAPFGSKQAGEIDLETSTQVGLHPGLVSLDVTQSDGTNGGFNPLQTAGPGERQQYCWYAGNRVVGADGKVELTPVEFGSVGLVSSDPLLHAAKGLVGALIVEPMGAVVTETDRTSHASAKVTNKVAGGPEFHEFVVVLQDSVEACQQVSTPNCTAGQAIPVGNFGSINYRTEPQSYRYPPNAFEKAEKVVTAQAVRDNVNIPNLSSMVSILTMQPTVRSLVAPSGLDLAALFSNSLTSKADPQTPVFTAPAGASVRFRMIFPGGDTPQVPTLQGHVWQEEPHMPPASNVPGTPVPAGNLIGLNYQSQWIGSQQMSPNETFDFVIDSAGGENRVPGDYLLDSVGQSGGSGAWALLRVTEK
jgi:hypothetical protein